MSIRKPMKIVPAILATTKDEFFYLLGKAESFTDYVQIDLMDGFFVPTRSFPEEKINTVETSISFELHLMVKHPAAFMSRIRNQCIKKVIFHFESGVKHLDFIAYLNKQGITPGMAVNPETKISQFRELGQTVDTLLFLTVTPGKYGSPFRPEVIDKIAESRKIFPDKTIAVDGGVSMDNLKNFLDIGVDYVCVGSKIFLDDDPEKSYKTFVNKIDELMKS
jgi:ribulose-phosphate 3-epimerase